MNILITEQIGYNSYIKSLMLAYKKAGLTIICGNNNFFTSNFVPDILHIHWPDRLYKWYNMADKEPAKQYSNIEERLKWYKTNNVKIIHTIHDLNPHNQFTQTDVKFYKLIIKYSDILIHHCNNSVEIFAEQYKDIGIKKNIVCRHGDYLIDHKFIPKSVARSKLNIPENKFVILNFGSQQKYKGEKNIESIFRELKISDKFLITAGNYSFAGYSKFQKLLKMISTYYKKNHSFKSKKYILRSIEVSELQLLFNSADIVLLGHTAGHNSGIINLSATFGKPVVFPKIGCFEDQVSNWEYKSYKVNDIRDAAAKIQDYYQIKQNSIFEFDNTEWLSQNNWNTHVHKILSALET